MARAREILGVRQEWLGFVDSGYPEGDPLPPLPEGCFGLVPVEVGTEALVRQIRAFRPHVITTYNEEGGYPHPDHMMCHAISLAAFDAAADPEAFPAAGDPWQPLKLYYDVGFNPERFVALDAAMKAAGLDSPFEEMRKRWEERAEKIKQNEARQPNITTRIVCADWFARRDAALIAHATQIDPTGWFFGVPMSIQREVWPYEDFELARSLVDSTIPEDDLFAGVREKVAT
jgi:mycothiol S-conjugate amidase